jgi:hypothetical protein
MFADALTASVAGVADSATPMDIPLRAAGCVTSCRRAGARCWGPPAYPGRAEGRVGKTRVKNKKNQPSGFFGFLGFFLNIFSQKKEFLGFFSFKNTFRRIQTVKNYNHSY